MEKRNKVLYSLLVVAACLVVGIGAMNYSVSRNISKAGGSNQPKVEVSKEEVKTEPSGEFGALPGSESSGDFIFRGQVLSGWAVNQAIAVSPTTTKNVYNDGRDRVDSVAQYTNTTGKTLVCSRLQLPIISSTGTWTYSYGVGTTTKIANSPSWTNTTTATLIASTTAANTSSVFADNFNLFTSVGNPGSYFTRSNYGVPTTSEFTLTNGTSIIAWIKTINATSSDSFVKNSGHRLTGSLQVDCRSVSY